MKLQTIVRTLVGAATLALLATAAPAAAQAQAQFQVTANVVRNCTISATDIAFGNYDTIVANDVTPLDATGTVTIRCTRGTAYDIELDPGLGTARTMANGAEELAYQLYSDAGHTTVWDATTTVSGVAANRAPLPITVHARVPAGQEVAEGAYADTVTATINF